MAGRFSVEAVFKAVDRISAPVSRMQNRIRKMTRSIARGLRTANRAVGRMASGLGRGLRRGAVVATAAVAGLTLAIDSVANRADKLAKESRRLQFPIKDLQEFQFVAEQSGVTNELLSNSLGAFSKRLGEAAGDTGPLVSGLKKINPELLKQLKASDNVSDSLTLMINAIRSADTATEKAALANAAFSRSGLALVNIADNSAEAIRKLRLQQRENGVITMEQAIAAEAYVDASNALKKTLTGFMQTVILPLLPLLTRLTKSFREWALSNKDIVAEDIFKYGRQLVDNFNDIVDVMKKIGIGLLVFFALSAALKTVVLVMTVASLAMTLMGGPIALLVLGIFLLTAAIIAVVYWWDKIKSAVLEFADAVVNKVITVFKSLVTAFKNSGDSMSVLVAGIALLMGPIGWLIGAAALIFKHWEPIKEFFADLWTEVVDIFDSAMNKIMSVVDRVKGAAADIVNTISNIGNGVGDFFGFGSDEAETDAPDGSAGAGNARTGPQIISPQERTARTIEESRTSSSAEVTIRDATGRAEVTSGSMGPGLSLQPSGAF